jgi:hypothetical protein
MAVRDCCLPCDANVILSIKLPNRACDDFIAWSGESNGMFSVRSAYRLGIQSTLENLNQGQSSSEPLGNRSIWNLIWKATVPLKLMVFAWKAATSTLAVCAELHHRIPGKDPVCTICGCEDDHHALVRCTLARALRDEMRKFWVLPLEEVFLQSGKEWLLHLLSNATADTRPKVIFLLWRVWHHRNNIFHGDGKASIVASAQFISNYLQSFLSVTKPNLTGHTIPEGPVAWTAPAEGGLKTNVDVGWDELSKTAGIGIVIRDQLGHPVIGDSSHRVQVRRRRKWWLVWRV